MAQVHLNFSRFWIVTLSFLFYLLFSRINGQKYDSSSSSLDNIQNDTQSKVSNKTRLNSEDFEDERQQIIRSARQESISNNGSYNIPFSALSNILKEKSNGAYYNTLNENQRDEQNRHLKSSKKDKLEQTKSSILQQSDIPLSEESNIWTESEYINPNEQNCSSSSNELIDGQSDHSFSQLFNIPNENEYIKSGEVSTEIFGTPNKKEKYDVLRSDSYVSYQAKNDEPHEKQHSFPREQYEIPFSALLNRQNGEENFYSKILNVGGTNSRNENVHGDLRKILSIPNKIPDSDSNSGIYEIPFSALFNNQHKKENTVPRKNQYGIKNKKPKTQSNQGLYEIPFSALFNAQNKAKNIFPKDRNRITEAEQINAHNKKSRDDLSQVYFKYDTGEKNSAESYFGNEEKSQFYYTSINNNDEETKYSVDFDDFSQLTKQDIDTNLRINNQLSSYGTSKSSAEMKHLKEVLTPDGETHYRPTKYIQQLNRIVAILQKNSDDNSTNDFNVKNNVQKIISETKSNKAYSPVPFVPSLASNVPLFSSEVSPLATSSKSLLLQYYLRPPNETYSLNPNLHRYDLIQSLDVVNQERFPLRKICDATFGQNSFYMPSIFEAILKAKQRRQTIINRNILVNRLSSIFLAKKVEYSTLTHNEVFTQLLLETFFATLEIIKHSESSCINHALEFRGSEHYVESLREILYLKRLFNQRSLEDVINIG